ncbi:MAG: hypothetical protein KC416_03010, partial [Myxococcales bacterium]|nr:hypothetical protein [Myxococcales bacterium]
QFLNASATTRQSLSQVFADVGLDPDDAAAVIISRNSADGEFGSPDDEPFGSLGDLLHPSIGLREPQVRAFVDEFVGDRCTVDWSKHVDWSQSDPLLAADFIHADTDLGTSTTGRDNSEIEVAMGVVGVPGTQLHAVLESNRGYRRLRKATVAEAFNYGLDPSQIPWDSEHHAAREAAPAGVALTIETNRYALAAEEVGGKTVYPELRPELDVGTDLNTDVYYDTREYLLLRNDATLRSRVRWDGVDCIRRLLVAAKFGTGKVDPATGIKQVAKVDVRTDSGGCGSSPAHGHLATMDADVRQGRLPWATSVPPIREIYERLRNPNEIDPMAPANERASVLPMAQAVDPDDRMRNAEFQEALGLEPKVHIFSARSRFHFNEAALTALDRLYAHGRTQLQAIIAYVDETGASGRGVTELRSAIDRALDELPDDSSPFKVRTDQAALDAAETAANDANRILHDLGARLGDDDDDISDDFIVTLSGASDDQVDEDRVDAFVAWRKIVGLESGDTTLARTQALDPFREYYQATMADDGNSDHLAERTAFVEFAERVHGDQNDPYHEHFEDFTPPSTEADWAAFSAQLDYEWLKIVRRQIEAAGTMAHAIWFDSAREFFVPGSSRAVGNFIIDTMDFTEFFTQYEWGLVEDRDRNSLDFNPKHVIHSSLVNEVQIELGSEEAYLDRIRELDQTIREHVDATAGITMVDTCEVSNRGSISDANVLAAITNCERTKGIFNTYKETLTYLGQIKGPDIVDRVRDVLEDNPEFGPVPPDIVWAPSDLAKGNQALLLLTGQL